jgi:hypothetical protein
MIHIECEQGSLEWHMARRGIPTASGFSRIMTPKTMKLAAAHVEYACELIGDLFSLDEPEEGYESKAMTHGILNEPEARAWYEMETNQTVTRAGFIVTDDQRFGCSPDGLVGEDGGLELKCPQTKTHVRYLLNGKQVPDEYKAQVHGNIIVTGRAWWDFLSYCPGLPPLLVRVEPDAYTLALKRCLEQFWEKFSEMLAAVRNFEEPQPPLVDLLNDAIAAQE